MSEIADLIRFAVEIIGRGKERRRAMESDSWDSLLETVSTLQELLRQHEAMIRAVVSPVIYDGNLSATCDRYRDLTESASVFSAAYEDVQGMLGVAHRFKQFEQGNGRNYLSLVSHRLGAFQYAAFCLQWKSEDMANLLYEAHRLHKQLANEQNAEHWGGEVAEQRERVRESFKINAFPALVSQQDEPERDVGPLQNSDQVIALVRDWCRDWLDHISKVLYRGGPCSHCGDSKTRA